MDGFLEKKTKLTRFGEKVLQSKRQRTNHSPEEGARYQKILDDFHQKEIAPALESLDRGEYYEGTVEDIMYEVLGSN